MFGRCCRSSAPAPGPRPPNLILIEDTTITVDSFHIIYSFTNKCKRGVSLVSQSIYKYFINHKLELRNSECYGADAFFHQKKPSIQRDTDGVRWNHFPLWNWLKKPQNYTLFYQKLDDLKSFFTFRQFLIKKVSYRFLICKKNKKYWAKVGQVS